MNYISLVLDSMFLANKLTQLLSQNKTDKRLLKITGKAWARHWRRVRIAKENGYPELKVPEHA